MQRFGPGASELERRTFGRRLLAELDAMGVPPGEWFIIAHPDVLDEPAEQTLLLDPDADIPRGARADDPETSKEAARHRWPSKGQRQQIIVALQDCPDGLTAEEVADLTGMPYVSASTRVSELKDGGWIHPRGTRTTSSGSEADVLFLTDAAQERVRHGGDPAAEAKGDP